MTRRLGALLMLLLVAACGTQQAQAPQPTGGVTPVVALKSRLVDSADASVPQAGQPAPDFEFTLESGKTMKLSDLRGKKVIVNFWATWCAPCRQEMPDLQKVAGEYGDSVTIVGVNTLERVDAIKPFAQEVQVGFPLVANPEGTIKDRYGVFGMPTSYFINRDGTVGFVKAGPMNYAFIKQQLDQLQ